MKLPVLAMETSTPKHFSIPRAEMWNLFCSGQKVTARRCLQSCAINECSDGNDFSTTQYPIYAG